MRFNLTPVVKVLLIMNVVVFLLQISLPLDIDRILALYFFTSSKFLPTQFITYMFAHADWGHLFGNMFGLVVFGAMLEEFLGPKRFLFLYFFTGIGAALLHTTINWIEISHLANAVNAYIDAPSAEEFYSFIYDNASYAARSLEPFMESFQANPKDPGLVDQSLSYARQILNGYTEGIPMLGASGAVLGVVIAFAMLFPNTELYLLFIPFPIKAKYIAMMYAAVDIYSLIENNANDNVAHFAHLGGMIFAAILVQYWKTRRDTFY